MKPNANYYLQKMNDIITRTEELGEAMHPFYEQIRSHIDEGTVDKMESGQLQEIYDQFSKGVTEYQGLLTQIKKLQSPVKVIGVHKKLEKVYSQYVAGCEKMVAAIDVKNSVVDQVQFDQSEIEQDEATDKIGFCIQKITSAFMK